MTEAVGPPPPVAAAAAEEPVRGGGVGANSGMLLRSKGLRANRGISSANACSSRGSPPRVLDATITSSGRAFAPNVMR